MYKTTVKRRPKKPYKSDGSLSAAGEKWFKLLSSKGLPSEQLVIEESEISSAGQKWFALLREKGLPFTTEVVYKESNPGST
jgi:hypothetical protein